MALPTFRSFATTRQDTDSASIVSTMPAGVVSTDALVAMVTGYAAGATTTFSAPGWTHQGTQRSGGSINRERTGYLTRISDGSEGASVTVSASDSAFMNVHIVAIQSGGGAQTFGTPTIKGDQLGDTMPWAMDTSGPDSMLVYMMSQWGITSITNFTNSVNPGTCTERFDAWVKLNAQDTGNWCGTLPVSVAVTENFNGSWNFGANWLAMGIEVGSAVGTTPVAHGGSRRGGAGAHFFRHGAHI